MTVERIELTLCKLSYVHFFETSFGREYDRTFILARVYADGLCGWGEVVAEHAPLYSGETTEGAWHVLKDFLVPLVFAEKIGEPESFAREARRFRGNLMAKAGLELAFWDLKARRMNVSLSKIYGGVRDEVEAGVSCGIEDSIPELQERIVSGRGLPADQDQDQAGLGRRGLRGRALEIPGHPAPGRRQRRLRACRYSALKRA